MFVPGKRRGVTYSRSITGTDMPSTKRSQARPIGRASKRRSLSRNCPFRDEQQPKLREMFLLNVYSIVILMLSCAVRVTERQTGAQGLSWSSNCACGGQSLVMKRSGMMFFLVRLILVRLSRLMPPPRSGGRVHNHP
jgi:hypothetical protein